MLGANGTCAASAFEGACGDTADCSNGLTCVGGVCSCGVIEGIGALPLNWSGMAAGTLMTGYTSATSPAVRFAECSGDCTLPQPELGTTALASVTTGIAYGGSIVALPGGGAAVAWTSGPSGSNQLGELHYTECAGDCLDAGSWVDLVVDSAHAGVAPPELALSATGVRGIAVAAFQGGGGHQPDKGAVLYAECSSSCTAAASWTEAVPDSQSFGGTGAGQVSYRPGFTFLNEPDAGPIRLVTDGHNFQYCLSNCTPGVTATTSGWSAMDNQLPVQSTGDQVLVQPSPEILPRLAVENCSQITLESCTTLACSTPADWTSQTLASDADCNSKIDFALGPDGLGRILYSSSGLLGTGGALMLAQESAALDGGTFWTESALTLCDGTEVTGTAASLSITASGGLRIHYANGSVPDGGAAHSLYTYGP